MAWIFSLSTECGSDRALAEEFARYFQGVSWILSNDRRSHCQTSVFQDFEQNWWCRVCPTNISEIGIDHPQAAYLMTELGILLYQHLRSAPAFRYALVGVEVDEFRTYSELIDELQNSAFPGLVLAHSLWQIAGSPSTFRLFKPGYV